MPNGVFLLSQTCTHITLTHTHHTHTHTHTIHNNTKIKLRNKTSSKQPQTILRQSIAYPKGQGYSLMTEHLPGIYKALDLINSSRKWKKKKADPPMFVKYIVITPAILYQRKMLTPRTTGSLSKQGQYHLQAGQKFLTCSSTTRIKTRFSLERQN